MQKFFDNVKIFFKNIKEVFSRMFTPRRRSRRRSSVNVRSRSSAGRKTAFSGRPKSVKSRSNGFFGKVTSAISSFAASIAGFASGLWSSFTSWLSKFDRKIVYACGGGIAAVIVAGIVLICVFAVPQSTAHAGNEGNNSNNALPAATAVAAGVETSAEPEATIAPDPMPTINPMTKTYKNGTKDEFVKKIQARLMKLHYMDDDIPTEKYGDTTTQAMMYFQRKNEMPQTGIADKKTLKRLFSKKAKTYTVSHGDDGSDVLEIQQRLVELGYIDKTTGHYGDETEAAIKTFQTKNGLSSDGTVGADTKEMLYSEDAKANFMAFGEKSTMIEKYQKKLKTLGYLTTEADGSYGLDTVNAVKRFQEMNGIIADGFLGPSTREILDNGTGKANALQLGVSGSDVLRIQTRLVELGYMYAKSATSYFGTDTETAIKKFQSTNGLYADGKVGTYTMNILFSDYAKKNRGGISSGGSSGSHGSSSHSSSGHSSSSGGGGGSSGGNKVTYNKSASSLISVAKSKLGCRYVLGAKGPNSFDCSGFVYYCLKSIGVNQSYWTSSGWRGNGKYQKITSMGSIRAGDIVSFGNGLNHVGIALGGGMMIDASSGDGRIRITALSQSYWQRHFYAAYRVLG